MKETCFGVQASDTRSESQTPSSKIHQFIKKLPNNIEIKQNEPKSTGNILHI